MFIKQNGKQIPYVYEYLLKKLVHQIVYNHISSKAVTNVNVQDNNIEILMDNTEKQHKLIKFIQKFQI